MPSRAIKTVNTMQSCTLLLAVYAIVLFSRHSDATPSVALPINSQLPPVANVGQPFNFTFSSSTFIASEGTLAYSLSDQPSWLQLDKSSRCLWGQPSSKDQGVTSFDLWASDSTGAASDHVQLTISAEPGPTAGDSLSKQLAQSGTFNAPNILLVYPLSPVHIQFDKATFANTSSSTRYSAIGSDRTPLPSWLQFDPSLLIFQGQTPAFTSIAELPQTFDIDLVASDISGFSQASITFKITVESHHITLNQSTSLLVVTPGESLDSKSLLRNILLDGEQVALDNNITVMPSRFPAWLHIDNQTLDLTGVVPADVRDTNSTVVISDNIGDAATATIQIVASTSTTTAIIEGQPQPIELYIGSAFNYTFERSDFASGSSVGFEAKKYSWLHFDNVSLSLWGTVPETESPRQIELKLKASLGSRSQEDVVLVDLLNKMPKATDASSTISLSPTSAASASPGSSTGTDMNQPSNHSSSKPSALPKRILAIAILLPILGAAVLCILVFFCHRKRSVAKRGEAQNTPWNEKDTCLNEIKMPGHRQLFPRIDRNSAILPRTRRLIPGMIRSQPSATPEPPVQRSQDATRVVRPPRPPSTAPQVGRIILERDPDPFREWVESESLNSHARNIAETQRRSASVPLRGSSFQDQRYSKPSFLGDAMASLSALGIGERYNAERHGHLVSDQVSLRTSGQGPFSSHRSFSANHLESGTWNRSRQFDSYMSRWSTDPSSSDKKTNSGSYATTASPIRTDEASDDQARFATEDRSGFDMSMESRNADRFRGSTVRPVTPSNKSTSIERSQRGSRSSIKRLSHRVSRSSHGSHRSIRPVSISPIKRGSHDFSNQLALHIKRRRQHPPTARFSNSNANSPILASPGFESLRKKIDKMSALADAASEQQRNNPDSPPKAKLPPEMSKARGERLGQLVQETFASLKESSSMRSKSSVATSEVSFQNIERQMEETEEQANYARRFGDQRRSSWHRLSVLPESQGSGKQDAVLKLRDVNAVGKGPMEMKSLQSTSCKGEVGEIKSGSEKRVSPRKKSLSNSDQPLKEWEKHFM